MFTAPIPENDSARLATLYSYSILDTLPERGYDDVTALASFICRTPFSTITLVDKDRQWFKSEVGFGTRETGRADGFCACAILQPETMIVRDTLLDRCFAENPFVLGGPQIRFYAGAPLIAPDGHVLGTVCVFDTEPRVLSADQIAALEALSRQVMSLFEVRLRNIENERAAAALMQSEKLAAVGRLASSMAHGINNPLEAVTNLLYLVRQRVGEEEIQILLDQAEQELRRVSVIANQTLHFHKQTSKPQAVSCLDLFSTTLNVYEARLRNAKVTVEKRKRANEPVECFEGDIRHVLGSIVANAIDAMPKGGRLIVRSREHSDPKSGRKGVMLTIADTGCGMNQVTQRRLFEAFFSTKGLGGVGLGLWTSAEIMKRHQGRISIRSSQRKGHAGTVVTLFLPFAPVTRDASAVS
ncbi:MAG TPA: HAMP domain-containing sensor histidine kinase [Acidobacteriaceae bacterium]|jgi:signal transduction histidine kinase|nr:HAMP domain-containing sensor histidine kinase [Acidobacteriaceae bacterium]